MTDKKKLKLLTLSQPQRATLEGLSNRRPQMPSDPIRDELVAQPWARPQRCVMVGDMPSDVAPARGLGLTAYELGVDVPELGASRPEGALQVVGVADLVAIVDAEYVDNLRAALGESMAGKPVTTANTTPYGCSLKYD